MKMFRFQGTYCGQDVAIKILKPERLNENLQREFLQEVKIMRYVIRAFRLAPTLNKLVESTSFVLK